LFREEIVAQEKELEPFEKKRYSPSLLLGIGTTNLRKSFLEMRALLFTPAG
jgi:hypothetical protein